MPAPLSSIHRTFANIAESQTDSVTRHRDDPPISAPGFTWAMTLKRSTWFDAATTT
jgi:hypothetical protein